LLAGFQNPESQARRSRQRMTTKWSTVICQLDKKFHWSALTSKNWKAGVAQRRLTLLEN
jgi:hypothetical protein